MAKSKKEAKKSNFYIVFPLQMLEYIENMPGFTGFSTYKDKEKPFLKNEWGKTENEFGVYHFIRESAVSDICQEDCFKLKIAPFFKKHQLGDGKSTPEERYKYLTEVHLDLVKNLCLRDKEDGDSK